MKSIIKKSKIDLFLIFFILASIFIYLTHFLAPEIRLKFIILAGVLGTLSVFWGAFKEILKKEISVDLLALIALIFSLLDQEWLSATFIALMILAARILEAITEGEAERSLQSLFKLRPAVAKVIKDNQITELPIKKLQIGDLIAVDLGDRIPVDGRVVVGTVSVDESSLTGESWPIDKVAGNQVFSSTMVVAGSAHVSVEKIGLDTTLEKIINLLQSSAEQKPRFQTIGEKFGKIYLFGIFAVSGLVFLLTHNTQFVLSVILVICADDVAVAVPLAYLSAKRRAAKMGVVVKGSAYLEALGNIDTIIFDKTGTLTSGHMQVDQIVTLSNLSSVNILEYSASLMEESSHPIAKAVFAYAKNSGIQPSVASLVEEVGGMGIRGEYRGKKIIFGRLKFLTANYINVDSRVLDQVSTLENQGKNISFVVVDGVLVGLVVLASQIRAGAKKMIEELRSLGVKRLIMLTGDNEKSARAVANELGITEFYAGLFPQQKTAFIKKLIDSGKTVAMVGDGVNDAASMRIATVGIAMGAIGYDTAIESADIVLMKDNLARIPDIMNLARFTAKISIQDFWPWGLSNVIGLGLVFTGVIGPSGAAAYNFITDFFPLLNSIRKGKLPK